MTHLTLKLLSHEDGEHARDLTCSPSRTITVSDVKNMFMCSASREDRLNRLYRIRSDLFTYDVLDIEDGYSPLIAEIDRALGLLELFPIGTADPDVLQRVDFIETNISA